MSVNLTRREFSMLGAAGLLSLAGGSLVTRTARGAMRRSLAAPYFKWQPIGTSAAAAFGEGGNTLVVWSKNEALLVDTKNAPFGGPLRREALAGGAEAAGGGAPAGAALTLVVNTHHHADHTGGNLAFTKDLRVLAHEKAKARVLTQVDRYTGAIKGAVSQLGRSDNPAAKDLMQEFGELADKVGELKAEQFAPTESMGSEKELKIGDVKVVMRHVGAGHTDNDIFLHFPDLNLIQTGDLLFHKNHPFMDRPAGANTDGWINSVRRIIDLCNDKTVVLPGHGELTDVSGLRAQIHYFEVVRSAVAKAVKDGKTLQEIKQLDLTEFRDYGLTQIKPLLLGAMYEEQTEKK